MSMNHAERLHPDIIEQAAQWMMRIGDAPDAVTEIACAQWRQADARHELAWQRLQGIRQDVNAATGGQVSGATAGQTILRYCDQRSRRSALKWMVGGVGLSGGRGGVRNVIVGTLLIGVLMNGMTIMDVQYTVQNVIKSLILLFAIVSDSIINPRDEQTGQQGDI